MNRTAIIVTAILAVGIVAFFGWPKIATWLDVAEDELSERIDTALGEFRVRETSISRGIQQLDDALDNVVASVAESRTRVQTITEKYEVCDRRVTNGKNALASLRDSLATGEPVALGNSSYGSESEKKKLIEDLLPRVEALDRRRAAYAELQETLSQQIDFLEATRANGRQRLQEMRGQLELIRAKVVTLETLKESSRIAGAGHSGFGSRFESLQTEIDETFAKLAGETAVEKEKLQDALGEASREIGDILNDSATDDLIGRIDVLLGE